MKLRKSSGKDICQVFLRLELGESLFNTISNNFTTV